MWLATTAYHGHSNARLVALRRLGPRSRPEIDGGPWGPSPIRRCAVEFAGDPAADDIGSMQKEAE
jgi:hypothetical protein